MIHGAEKHVIIIKNPDKHLFEQVIFVLKRDLFEKTGKARMKVSPRPNVPQRDMCRRPFQKGRNVI